MPSNVQANRKSIKGRTKPGGTAKSRQLVPRYPPNPHSFAIVRNLSFAPARMRRTLRYCQSLNLVGTSGAIGSNSFALNGTFDPDTTGTGHQPLGWDQYIAMYQAAVTLSCRVTVDYAQSGVTVPTIVAITGFPSTTTYAAGLARIEAGSTAYKLMPSDTNIPITLTSTFDIASMVGVDDLSDEPDYYCSATSNPTNVVGGQVWARDLNGTSTVNISCLVLIEYDILFLKPFPVAES